MALSMEDGIQAQAQTQLGETITPLQEALRAVLLEGDGHVSHVDWPHAYASEALKCSRMIGLRLLTNDTGHEQVRLNSLLAFSLGDHIHERIQSAFKLLYADFVEEVRWERRDWNMTGRADGMYTDDEGVRVIVEIKSMTPAMFVKAVKRDAPHYEHALQAQISAVAKDAQAVHLVYVNKAPRQTEEAMAEWYAEVDTSATMAEIERLSTIVANANAGILSERFYDGDVIDNPERKKWPCEYCNVREWCIRLGAGEKRLSAYALDLLKAPTPAPGTTRIVIGNDGAIEAVG